VDERERSEVTRGTMKVKREGKVGWMKVKQCGVTCETMKWLTLNISDIFCIGKSLRKLPSTHVTPVVTVVS
jgi:hypothetical protein